MGAVVFDRDNAKHAKRPNLFLMDNKKRKAWIVEIAVAADQLVQERITEKREKYNRLRKKVKSDLQLESVKIVPIVIGTSGRITRDCLDNLRFLPGFDRKRRGSKLVNEYEKYVLTNLQSSALLDSVAILGLVLGR